MSYTEEIIKDSYNRFKNGNWSSIASERIDEAYKKRGQETVGQVEYYNFTITAILFMAKFIIAAIIIIITLS